ncbi:hypothetical protein ACFLSQ_06830 [Bacteroidota bacterium]
MKKSLSNILFLIFLGCTSIDLPPIEESRRIIDFNTPQLKVAEMFIKSKTMDLPTGNDIDIAVKRDLFNRILSALANDRKQDIQVFFPPTKPLIKDEKNILGIKYTNYINVDKGYVSMNIKTLKFLKMRGNKVEALIEIEGKGKIKLSAKNTGISASVSSNVKLYLKENVEFKLKNSDSGFVILKPQPKKLSLKSKFTISILEWNIPWREEIEIEFTDILNPIAVPMAIAADIDLPIPVKFGKKGHFKDIPYKVKFSKVRLFTDDNVLRWKSYVHFKKKN